MGSQASCCNCKQDTPQQQNLEILPESNRDKKSVRISGRVNPYAPKKMPSNRIIDTTLGDIQNKNNSNKHMKVEINKDTVIHKANDDLDIKMRDQNKSDQVTAHAYNVFGKQPDTNIAANIGIIHKRDLSADYVKKKVQPVYKSKTEELQAAFLNADISNTLNPRILDNQWLNSFQIMRQLNKEIFSEVYLIKMLGGSQEVRILRKVKKIVFKDPTQGIEDYRYLLEELLQLEHPNITQLYDYKEDQYNFYLVLEYCKGGKLFDKIEQLTEMSENLAAEVCRQILSTIVYLHSKSYVYRNLSPDVLLLEEDENILEGFNLKLINIDLQCALTAAQHQFYSTPLYFQSPEALNTQQFTDKQDVWACGVLLTILLTGEPPQQCASGSNFQMRAIIENQFDFDSTAWREISPNAIEFVKKLLEIDTDNRIKAVTALNDKWLLNIIKARRNNQRKILNQKVIQQLKKFIAELKFYQSVSELIQQVAVNAEEEKILMGLFEQKDTIGEGDLKMDQIREAYSEFCGRFVDRDEVDMILEKCTVQVNKKGMIKFSQFVFVKSKKAVDQCKAKIKKQFSLYDQKRVEAEQAEFIKTGFLYKNEVKKLLGAIITSNNNNQSENTIQDFDKDQDGYLTIDEVIDLVTNVTSII